MASSVVGVPG